jgi:serine phosphatase RsbU (regulator of sigma subunit)
VTGPSVAPWAAPGLGDGPGPAGGAGLLGGSVPTTPERLRVLLVEDDEGDAFLVRELLAEAAAPIDLAVASSLREARQRLAGVHCVLLDLGLPDAQGFDGLRQLLAAAGGAAVCVLTGRFDEPLGVAAVAEGAQDYLVKGQVDGVLLTRALRYAVERKRADENTRKLREVELRQAESARLERGLLPQPLMDTDLVRVHTFYRTGRAQGLLGGDFFDVVQTAPDRLHLIVGDVCGHSVDEAALGVELRVAWRALILGGVADEEVLPAVEQVLMSERRSREVFATVAAVTVDLSANRASVRLAGHPPPVLLSGGGVAPVAARGGIVLGVRPTPTPATEVALGTDDWSLLMYTDGLIEGRVVPGGRDRLDVPGLCALLAEPEARQVPLPALPGWLVGRAEQGNGGPLADDVAMLVLTRGGGR